MSRPGAHVTGTSLSSAVQTVDGSGVGEPPSTGIVHTRLDSFSPEQNARCVPSGDHAGAPKTRSRNVRRLAAPPSVGMTWRSEPRPSERTNASDRPSGDIAGY